MMNMILMIFMLVICSILLNEMVMMKFLSLMLNFLSFLYLMLFNFMDWFGFYGLFIMDYYSYILVFLSIWIISLMFLIEVYYNKNMYCLLIMILLIILIFCFISMNCFLFYLFFEISLIPIFMIILGWGYQFERINAVFYMLFYTLFASLPLLILLLCLYKFNNSLNYLIVMNKFIEINMMSYIFYLIMLFCFLVKMPLFLFHLWLPKAHVEAPVAGSMILAGIMLKLGGYGLYRFMLMMLNYSKIFNIYFMILSLISIIYLSLMCLRLYDLKILVAYSSVVHMGVMLLGIFSLMLWGVKGGLLMMIGHGLCSSGLFFIVNLFYLRSKSRMILLNKGMVTIMFNMFFWWFIFCMGNMGIPFSLNLFAELMVFCVMLDWSLNILLFLILGSFLSASYSIYMFSIISHGMILMNMKKIFFIDLNEFLNLILHFVPLYFFFFNLNWLI